MRKKITQIMWSMILTGSLLAGCGTLKTGSLSSDSGTAQESTSQNASSLTEDMQNTDASQSDTAVSTDDMFTDRDFETAYEEDDCVSITLSDNGIQAGDGVSVEGNTATITAEGTYLLSGSMSDGQVIVNADENAKLRIILNQVELTSADLAPIYIKQADKVFITLKDGTQNTLSATGAFAETAESEDNIDAVVFSKSDLTLNGNGSLTISTDTGNGITSKDDLVLTGGSYIIQAGNHGLEGKDSVRIAAGAYSLTTGKDGIHSSNSEEEDKGFIYILDGEISIQAKDDGIHAEKNMTVNGGTITVLEGYEGMEGMTMDINGGSISITSSDDGLNAESYIRITGGTLVIDAQGDGVDSNGALYVSGGETYISGPTNSGNGALDYNSTAEITGGIFVAAGASGMAMNFKDTSTQGAILVNTASMQTGATVLSSAGEGELLRYTPVKEYNSILISIPEITAEGTYTVAMGDETQELTMESLIYGSSSGMSGGRGMMEEPGGRDGQRPGGENGEMMPPDGMTPPDEMMPPE